MRRYVVQMVRANVMAELVYECYDEGEPNDGDCIVVESDEPLRELAPVGSDPQDVVSRLLGDGWRIPEPK